MAASRSTSSTASSNPRRISFAKIKEPLEVPQLLALQTDSFDWLIGNHDGHERNLLLLKGSVPGAPNGYLLIRKRGA